MWSIESLDLAFHFSTKFGFCRCKWSTHQHWYVQRIACAWQKKLSEHERIHFWAHWTQLGALFKGVFIGTREHSPTAKLSTSTRQTTSKSNEQMRFPIDWHIALLASEALVYLWQDMNYKCNKNRLYGRIGHPKHSTLAHAAIRQKVCKRKRQGHATWNTKNINLASQCSKKLNSNSVNRKLSRMHVCWRACPQRNGRAKKNSIIASY